jgi:hypothetical protein
MTGGRESAETGPLEALLGEMSYNEFQLRGGARRRVPWRMRNFVVPYR